VKFAMEQTRQQYTVEAFVETVAQWAESADLLAEVGNDSILAIQKCVAEARMCFKNAALLDQSSASTIDCRCLTANCLCDLSAVCVGLAANADEDIGIADATTAITASSVAAVAQGLFQHVCDGVDSNLLLQLLERFSVDLDICAPRIFSGMCRLDAELLLSHQEERVQSALQGICAWSLAALGYVVGFESLSSRVFMEYALGDSVWALILAKGLLSMSASHTKSCVVAAPANLPELQYTVLRAVLGLASPDIAFVTVGSEDDADIVTRNIQLVRHRTEVAQALLNSNFLKVLAAAVARSGPALGPSLVSFLVNLLQPELVHTPDWVTMSDAATAALQEARQITLKLEAYLPQYSIIIWYALAEVPKAFGGKLPAGFVQDSAYLAYFCKPPERTLICCFLENCLSSTSAGCIAADDASVLGALCILAANSMLDPAGTPLFQALHGLNVYGQELVFDRWGSWRAPVRQEFLSKWASVIINQPQSVVKVAKFPPPPQVETQQTAPNSQQVRRGAFLRDLVQEAPVEFLCAWDGQLMMDPIRSPHGHVFDRVSLANALSAGEGCCPITKQPTCLAECKRLPELRRRIAQWVRTRSVDTRSKSRLTNAASDNGP